MSVLSVIGDIASILSLLVAIYVAGQVVKLRQSVSQGGDGNKAQNQNITGDRNSQIAKQ